ncbi:unnamed protein product [Ceratitis capitata]|uniref:(Mediterranean fruit fly) hypothetical protein n=1 Tax=Ceratitis capitata TaxID=7213 RepID=W8C8R3_CERCA|nr:unnamed protein product [Ceratitis capitata]
MDNVVGNIDNAMLTPKSLVGHQMCVTEIPDMVAVETRFITHQMAKQRDMLLSEALILSPETYDTRTAAAQILNSCVANMVDMSVQTDSRNPLRNRGQQTIKLINQHDVGIQCDLDNDIYNIEGELNVNPLEDCNSDKYESFLKYVNENTFPFKNCKKECLICGEICANAKKALSHMATHWGPPALCENCGQQFEHLKLLIQHQCSSKSIKRIQHQQCPLYSCGILVKSTSLLADHLNEHLGLASYRCLPCRRIFHTREELRQHSVEHKRCSPKFRRIYKSSHTEKIAFHQKRLSKLQRYAGVRRPLRWYFKDMLRCQICLVRYLSTSLFARHRQKCIKKFKQRLEYIHGDT